MHDSNYTIFWRLKEKILLTSKYITYIIILQDIVYHQDYNNYAVDKRSGSQNHIQIISFLVTWELDEPRTVCWCRSTKHGMDTLLTVNPKTKLKVAAQDPIWSADGYDWLCLKHRSENKQNVTGILLDPFLEYLFILFIEWQVAHNLQ